MAKKEQETEQLRMKEVPLKKEELFSGALEDQNVQDPQVQQVMEVSEGQVSIFDQSISDSIIDESLARERLKEAIEYEKPKTKKKTLAINLIFLAINIAVLAFIINVFLMQTDGMTLDGIIKEQGSRLWWLAAGLALLIITFLADTLIFSSLIKRSTGKRRFWLAYKTSAVGKYFDSITPFAVGGRPSQINTLSRAGISPGIATSIPIIKMIIYNIIYSVSALVFLIFGAPFIQETSIFVNFLLVLFKIFAYLGVGFTAVVSLVFVLIGSGKIVGRSVVRFVVRLLYKLKFVKDYRESYNKIMNQVLEYQSSIQYLKKNKRTLLACIFYCIIEIVAYYAIPFTVVMAFSDISLTNYPMAMMLLLVCMTKFIICQMAAVVIPLPGGTGIMEISFLALFGVSSLVGQINIVWALVAWRLLTYYLTIVQGFTISTIDNINRMVKTRKEQKKTKINTQE